jgi:hypothetical protein
MLLAAAPPRRLNWSRARRGRGRFAMRRLLGHILFGCLLLLAGALAARAQADLTRHINVSAGSPEDKALTAIGAADDPTQKLALIDKFMTDFGQSGDLAIIGNQQYLEFYVAQKNTAKIYEYGDKILAADPDNFDAAVTLTRAANDAGDTEKLYAYAEKAGQILQRFKAEPAPAGTDAGAWQGQQKGALAEDADSINYVEYAFYNSAFQDKDMNHRADLMTRYAAAFPDSSYTAQAVLLVPFAYQAAQNFPKMVDAAQAILAKDPNNVQILLLLADFYSDSDNGHHLDVADTDAKKALDVLATAKKPDAMNDADWQKQVASQKGVAWSTEGEVDITRKLNAQAVTALQTAAPLLKDEPTVYARNQYRLGFAFLNLKRNPDAYQAFTDAASVDTPYRPLAQEKLAELKKAGVGPPVAKRPAKKSS